MRKAVLITLIFLLIAGAAFAANLRDGVYFAQEDVFADSGWKYNVTLVVKNGKIKDVSWNGSSIDAGTAKDDRSRDGQYHMVEYGNAIAPWWKQAEAVEKKLLRSQDINSITLSDAEGHTDAVSGATIHVAPFVNLVKEALAAGPVGYGPYKDGVYSAQERAFDDNGYKSKVEVTVTSGYIVAVDWDAIAKDGSDNKAKKSMDGTYGMVRYGEAMAPWFEQARAAEKHVLDSQSLRQPDAVSGASIHLEPFYALLNDALRGARR